MIKKTVVAVAAVALLFPTLALSAVTTARDKRGTEPRPSSGSGVRQFTLSSGLSDGTPLAITIVASSSSEEGRAQAAMSAAASRAQAFDAGIAALEGQLARLADGQTLQLSPDAFAMISKAVAIAGQTDGWFDIASPSSGNMFRQRDWRRIVLDPHAMTLRFKSGAMQLDLRRVSRGYIADLCMDEILRAGFSNALIDVGGVRWIAGRDLFTPWSIQIGFGGGTQHAYRAFTYTLTNIAAATITGDGLGAGLIDPKSKKPVPPQMMRSITILAADATTAVAYGLAAYALGPRIGMRFVEAHPEVRGILVDNDGALAASAGLSTPTAGQPPASDASPATPDGGPNDLKLKQNEEEREAGR